MNILLGASLLLQVARCVYVPAPFRKATEQPSKRLNWLDLAQFNFKPYILTDICVDCSKDSGDDPLFNCSIAFGWEDPNANTTCACEYEFHWDGANPAPSTQNTRDMDYFACQAETKQFEYFQFKFETMFGPSNFTLMLSHLFKDSKDFPSPEMANLFSQRNITLSPIENSDTSLGYFLAGPVEARINGATI